MQGVPVNEHQIRQAFDDVLDQALVFHGFADYVRDYELYIYATADPRTGIEPEHLRYRFTHCVRATVSTAVRRDVWFYSQDDDLIDYETWIRSGEREAYVWGASGRPSTRACSSYRGPPKHRSGQAKWGGLSTRP